MPVLVFFRGGCLDAIKSSRLSPSPMFSSALPQTCPFPTYPCCASRTSNQPRSRFNPFPLLPVAFSYPYPILVSVFLSMASSSLPDHRGSYFPLLPVLPVGSFVSFPHSSSSFFFFFSLFPFFFSFVFFPLPCLFLLSSCSREL